MSLNTKSQNKDRKCLFHVITVLYENRYCNQDGFSILVCGGCDVYQLKVPTFTRIKFPSMLEPSNKCKTAVIDSDIFVIGGNKKYNWNPVSYIEMFSYETKTWYYKTQLRDERNRFCVCSFK